MAEINDSLGSRIDQMLERRHTFDESLARRHATTAKNVADLIEAIRLLAGSKGIETSPTPVIQFSDSIRDAESAIRSPSSLIEPVAPATEEATTEKQLLEIVATFKCASHAVTNCVPQSQVQISFMEPCHRFTNYLVEVLVHRERNSHVFDELDVVELKRNSEGVESKFGAYHIFDSMLKRNHKVQQMQKKRKLLKSRMFKYKYIGRRSHLRILSWFGEIPSVQVQKLAEIFQKLSTKFWLFKFKQKLMWQSERALLQNPHYCKIVSEQMAVRKAASKAMRLRKVALVEGSWCKILRAARILSLEAEALMENAEKAVVDAFEEVSALGVIMHDIPNSSRRQYRINTSGTHEGGSPTHTVTASFDTAFDVDHEVTVAVQTAFAKLANCLSLSTADLKDLLRKISENPTKLVDIMHEKVQKRQSFRKFSREKLVDIMLERIQGLHEDQLSSLASIIAIKSSRV